VTGLFRDRLQHGLLPAEAAVPSPSVLSVAWQGSLYSSGQGRPNLPGLLMAQRHPPLFALPLHLAAREGRAEFADVGCPPIAPMYQRRRTEPVFARRPARAAERTACTLTRLNSADPLPAARLTSHSESARAEPRKLDSFSSSYRTPEAPGAVAKHQRPAFRDLLSPSKLPPLLSFKATASVPAMTSISANLINHTKIRITDRSHDCAGLSGT
jgi:hypothetical protein